MCILVGIVVHWSCLDRPPLHANVRSFMRAADRVMLAFFFLVGVKVFFLIFFFFVLVAAVLTKSSLGPRFDQPGLFRISFVWILRPVRLQAGRPGPLVAAALADYNHRYCVRKLEPPNIDKPTSCSFNYLMITPAMPG